MKIFHKDSNRKIKCRECGKYVKKPIGIIITNPTTFGYNPIYFCLCNECLETLRCEIDALTILVKSGVNTK
jgi:hypothetical protein